MKNGKVNIIQKQTLNLHYNGKADGFVLQKDITDWYYQELFPELQSMMGEIAPGNVHVRIDKLEMDLFVKGTGDWKKTLRKQVMENLGKQLLLEIQNSNTVVQNNIVGPAGNFLLLLTYYLQNGFLPWWSSIKTKNEFDAALEEWLLSDDSREHVSVIKAIIFENDVVYRIARFEEKNFDRLIKYFTGSDFIIQEIRKLRKDALAISELLTQAKKESISILLSRVILENVAGEGYDLRLMATTFANSLMTDFIDELKNIDPGLILSELLKEEIFTRSKEKNIFKQEESSATGKKETGSKKEADININQKEQPSKLKDKDGISKMDNEKSTDENKSISLNNDISGQKETTSPVKNGISDRDQKKHDVSGDIKEGIFVHNAGLVIVASFLPMFFKKLSLLSEANELTNKNKAVLLVQYLASGKEFIAEFELGLSKILCGLEMETPVNTSIILTSEEKEEASELLLSAIEYWSILKNTSVDGLRHSFLVRDGKLSFNKNEWLLQVEQKPYDMLLQNLPWNISMIKLPWMKNLLKTEWV